MITLSDILIRGVQLEWHEAVALLRDVIDHTSQNSHANSVPEPHNVELLHWGEVQVHESARVPDPVERLQQMLEMLLGTNTLPPQFGERLLQSHASVDDFSEALAYFERPDRAAILQGVYSRASGSSLPPNADELIASLRAATAVPVTEPGEAHDETEPSSKKLLLIGGSVFAVVAVVVGAVIVLGWGRAESADSTPTLVSRVTERVAGVTAAVGTAVASLAGREPVAIAVPTPGPDPDAEKLKTTPAPGNRAARSSPSSRAIGNRPTDQDLTTEKQVGPPGIPAGARAGGEVISRVLPGEDPTTVYGDASPGVTAPQLLRPHLPRPSLAARASATTPRLGVVVLQNGTVESVKLLDTPRSINDSMLLSAVKAWRFIPAMKDGAPVPYRMTIWVVR